MLIYQRPRGIGSDRCLQRDVLSLQHRFIDVTLVGTWIVRTESLVEGIIGRERQHQRWRWDEYWTSRWCPCTTGLSPLLWHTLPEYSRKVGRNFDTISDLCLRWANACIHTNLDFIAKAYQLEFLKRRRRWNSFAERCPMFIQMLLRSWGSGQSSSLFTLMIYPILARILIHFWALGGASEKYLRSWTFSWSGLSKFSWQYLHPAPDHLQAGKAFDSNKRHLGADLVSHFVTMMQAGDADCMQCKEDKI